MATIKDIAKEAGVSLGTVSNMINKSAKVSKELSDRINKAIKKLKYVPNVHAKNLRLRTTKSFHIVLQDLDITTKDIVSKIISSCEDKKYTCTLFVTYYSSFKEEQFLKDIVKLGTDGVFLQSCSSTITKAQKDVLDKNIPIVYLDNYPSTNEHHSVAFNNYEYIHNGLKKYLATHQIKPKDICLVHAGKQYNSDVDVESGIKDLIEEGYRNIKVDPRTESSFIKLINKIDEYTDKPKLYISTKDSIAKSIHKALHFFNLKADIMFFSNNEEIYKDNEIPIKRNAFGLGKKAFELMVSLLQEKEVDKKHISINPKLGYENENISIDKNKTLNLVLYDGPTSYSLMPSFKAFELIYGIKINYKLLNYEDLFEYIQTSIERKRKDDVYMIDLPWFTFFNNNRILYPLNKFIEEENDLWLNNFSSFIKNKYFYTDKFIYSIPILVNMQFMFYRKDLFENNELQRLFFNEYGYELETPKSWKQFEDICAFFTKSNNKKSPVKYGTIMYGLDVVSVADEFYSRQWYYGGSLVDKNGKSAINSFQNKRALESIKSTLKSCPKDSLSLSWQDTFSKLTNKEIAIHFTFSTHINLKERNSSIDLSNIGVALAPGKKSILGGYNLGVSALSENKKEAFAFIKWLTNKNNSIENTLLGCCIPHNSVFQNEECSKAFPWLDLMSNDITKAAKPLTVKNIKGEVVPLKVVNNFIFELILESLKSDDIDSLLIKYDKIFRKDILKE